MATQTPGQAYSDGDPLGPLYESLGLLHDFGPPYESLGLLHDIGYAKKADPTEDSCFRITQAQYFAHKSAKTLGTANPSNLDNAYWKFMIRNYFRRKGSSAWSARNKFADGTIRIPEENPVWCFERFGRTTTKLPDGRLILIGGEHEGKQS